MPVSFKILGCENGFNFCPIKLSDLLENEEGEKNDIQIIKDFDLYDAMNLYWNMYGVSYSGGAMVDYHHHHFYNRKFEFSTEFETTLYGDMSLPTHIALRPRGNFITEPKDRTYTDFSICDEQGITNLMLQGPYLNDIDYNLKEADIKGTIYAFSIHFDLYYSFNELLITTSEKVPSDRVFREKIRAEFDKKPFFINVSTMYDENITPDYAFFISEIKPLIYKPQEYFG